MDITVGDVLIAEVDVPNSVNLDAGTLRSTILYTSAGKKILKITGAEEADIVLDGDLRAVDRGGTPLDKLTRLAALRRAGRPVDFRYGTRLIRSVTITDFTPGILLGAAVRYHLVLSQAINGAPPASATRSTQEQIETHIRTMTMHATNVGPASTAAANAARLLIGQRVRRH